MEGILQTIRQDIEAALRAFEREDFENLNIFANRIMADVVFSTEGKLALPGFFLKNIAFVYGNLKTRAPATSFSTAKSIGSRYLDSLGKLVAKSDFDENRLWQEYHEFSDKIRKFQMNEFEETSYKDNLDFTHHAIKWLIRYLDEKRDILFDPNNVFLKGLLNEMDRIFRVHGGELIDTYAISLVTALDGYYDYFRLAYKTPDAGINQNKVKEIIFPFVDKIVNILSSEEINVSEVDGVLWELIRGWREFFIHYMELRPRPGFVVERGIELPEEAKKRLTETITRALEKEVGVKK
ncbi:hypothetical protein KEJ47_08800 [Candidatus Bathyarchaeota archaeon]|nr:hypothetical protein [Candidatus Bathyarchaeota archaeon]